MIPAAIDVPTLSSHRRVDFLGVPIDLLSPDHTVAVALGAMVTRRHVRHVALNVAKFVAMRTNNELRQDVLSSDIVGIDGMGIVLGLRLLGLRHVERVSGVDLMFRLLQECATAGRRPYILGARQDVLAQAAARACGRYPGLTFAGLRNGYFTPQDEAEIVATIAASGADCLFIALPTPAKERFLHRYAGTLGVPFVMGVGGSVDILAGHIGRAPAWMQASGLEWLHRLLQEPRRMIWRYTSTNTRFLAILVSAVLRRALGQNPLRPIADHAQVHTTPTFEDEPPLRPGERLP
jgi:N-acetylglucosaminyldiphosphoundecaprenol N-acetyl-beta-D-mannosaminyltransferase